MSDLLKQSFSAVLVVCGQYGRWVLPIGLVCGFLFPGAAEPLRQSITPGIWLLLFVAVLRLASQHSFNTSACQTRRLMPQGGWLLLCLVLMAQLMLPVLVWWFCTLLDVPLVWTLAATLVAAAAPISGSPNLVMLLDGDGSFALQWLVLGTLLLPLTCLPVMLLLYQDQPASLMVLPSLRLLLLILSASACALLVAQLARARQWPINVQLLDGVASITLAVIVVGLMSAVHHPATTVAGFLMTLGVALLINVGYQFLACLISIQFQSHNLQVWNRRKTVATSVINGNRNIALYLTALPPSSTDLLLLFIACYQIPMYLTPLIGRWFYRRVGD